MGIKQFFTFFLFNDILFGSGATQLTKLKDGIAIGCAFNHAILDGTATWHFMSSWAEVCSGSSTISGRPFLERTKVRDTRVKLDLSRPPSNGTEAANGASVPKLRERVFKFSQSVIDNIKSTVNANLPYGSKQFSTFQSLSVHIWRHVTKARSLEPGDYTVFTVFADCRKRVNPPMPDSYFGNLIQAIFTATKVALLIGNPPEFGADVIQKAIESHDTSAIEQRNKEWESAPKIFEFKDAGVNCVAVGSSPRFKVYEVNFGWGKPEGVRSGSNNRFDGMVYLYQGKSGGRSIDVEISLEAGIWRSWSKTRSFFSHWFEETLVVLFLKHACLCNNKDEDSYVLCTSNCNCRIACIGVYVAFCFDEIYHKYWVLL